MNPDDAIRDKLLRFLYERHKTTKGITKIPIGIRDLQKAMKSSYGLALLKSLLRFSQDPEVAKVCKN